MKKLLPILLVGSSIVASATEIKSINFENLNQLSQVSAMELIDMQVGQELSIKKVNQSLKKLFEQGYFEDIQVFDDNGNIKFVFIEKKIIASVSVDGYKSSLKERELYDFLGLRKGEIFSQKKIEKVKQRIIDDLTRDGKVDSQVEVKIDEFNERSVAITFMVNEGEEIIIKELNLVGAKNLDDGDFDEFIANKARQFMGWMLGRNDGKARLDELPLDSARIKSVYAKEGYIDAQVSDGLMEVDFSKYEAVLTYKIDEGNQYTLKKVSFTIDNPLVKEDYLKEDLKLRIDKTYNGQTMSKDLETIRNRVKDLGYAYANVFPQFNRINDKEVEINYVVSSGEKVYINDVIISGNVRTIDRVIRRDVFLAPNDLYNYTEIEESRKALKRTGYFDEVEIIEKKREDLDNKIDIIVKIQEARTGSITLGGGYGTADGFSVTTSISDKNIFGSGIEVKAQVDTSSSDRQFDVSVFNPRIRDSKYSAGVNAYLREYESDTYDSTTNGLSVVGGRKLNRYTNASLRLTYTNVDVDDKYMEDNINESAQYSKISLIPGISFNNTDNYLLPREGIKASTSLEYAGIGGDLSFLKSYSKFNAYYGLKDLIDFDFIARYKAKVGYIIENDDVPSNERYTLGGLSSVRGFKSGSLYPKSDIVNGYYTTTGGLQQAVNSIEFSIPITKSDKLRFTTFYDYGMLGEDNFTDIKRSSYGFSFDWVSPLGPLQFIFPQALDDKEGDSTTQFEFSLGRFF
jgi:outer membrane protein insertion porin family